MIISDASRRLYDKLARGWNTWDVNSVAAHVHLPAKLRLNVAFVVPHMSGYSGDSLWANVESFGEHAICGSYTEIDLRYLGGVYKVETTSQGRELLIKITPLKARYNCYVCLEISGIWGSQLAIEQSGDRVAARCEESVFDIDSLNPQIITSWDPATAIHLTCSAADIAYFRVNSDRSSDEIDQTIAGAREKWLDETVTADGALGEGLTAMRRSLLWNMVYDTRHGRVITPVSRNWCTGRGEGFGDYVLFGWDTFFAALQFGLIDKDLAYSTFFTILEEITPEGMIPNFGAANGRSRDRSEPQVGSLCAWKLYLQFSERWFIEECFDRLLSWNRWRFRERDGNGDGLLELASTPWPVEFDEEVWGRAGYLGLHQKLAAQFESGLDNSTMWDRAVFNEEKHCLELSYVGLNAEMVVDCECLEKMAALLGKETERVELAARRLKLSELINEQLWDEKIGCYLNKHWSGGFDPCLALTHFYPITAGIVPPDRLARLLNEHLLNEDEFWGPYVIPNVSRSDPSFVEQEYWRGRIWAPTNFLVGEGLARIGRHDIGDELAAKGLALFVKCWREKGVVGENYNAVTGEAAENGKASDRFYHWGALLVYMAVARGIYFDPWLDRVVFRGSTDYAIRNLPLGNGKVTLEGEGGIT